MTYRAHKFLKAVPQQFQSGAERLIKAIIVEDFKRPEPVDGYNEMLVQLSDEHVTEMYKNFMLIYVEEADDEVFKRMRIKESDVDAPVLGFCEMMTIKLGVDHPNTRIAADLDTALFKGLEYFVQMGHKGRVHENGLCRIAGGWVVAFPINRHSFGHA